uniref:NADH-ubiquinone oxidoreductase chain 3 n=1 Tax=Meteorus pulchricornis TaxID=51522 RepID=A0A857V021_9HYME|nr:NADH dehydrogenase subunit 3 [Meteorus pulchricornis]QHS69756.1 NADH dehydrogenase subunit 3 [Meteorus pulchricornis]WCB99548.1 NADH dehydrogenase subunit 3 [Meteorus pulchricornis]
MLLLILVFMMIFIISMIFYLLNLIIFKKIFLIRMKSSPFECGFEMFESIRLPFSIHFFLIGVLFLVFDIEIIYLFTMINSLKLMVLKIWMFISLMILLILYLGLEFEKMEGSLKWFI